MRREGMKRDRNEVEEIDEDRREKEEEEMNGRKRGDEREERLMKGEKKERGEGQKGDREGIGIEEGIERGETQEIRGVKKSDIGGTKEGERVLETRGDELDELALGRGTNTRDRETRVKRGTQRREEERTREIELTVGDADDISGDKISDIGVDGFDDREAGNGARERAKRTSKEGRALKQGGMNIKDSGRICISRRNDTENEINLTIAFSVLREIIEADKTMETTIGETFSDGDADGGHKEGEKRGRRGMSSDNEGEVVEEEKGDELGELREVETDANVEREETFRTEAIKRAKIGNREGMKEGAEKDGGLACVTIAENELTLTTADRKERVDDTNARDERLVDLRSESYADTTF
jgi:hypothetical protein